MISKISSGYLNQNHQTVKNNISFNGICLLQKEYGTVCRVPCNSNQELTILNKLLDLSKKGKIKFAESFQTPTGPWKEKYLKGGFRKAVIQVQSPQDETPKIEYLVGKRLYILQQTAKETAFLYNALLDGLKKSEGNRLNIKKFIPKAIILPFNKK